MAATRRDIISAAREINRAKEKGEHHPWFEVEPHVETMRFAVGFAQVELDDGDALGLLKLNCLDEQVKLRWEARRQAWRNAGGELTDKPLVELQALFEWNMQFIGLIDNELNG